MVDAPDKIWAKLSQYGGGVGQSYSVKMPNLTEYVRADLYEQVKRERDEFRDIAARKSNQVAAMIKAEAAERLAGARVKPLEWRGTEGVWAKADALFGATYRITEYAGMAKPFKLETVGFVGPSGHYELIDEAKAASQADYERRIVAALAEPAGEAEPLSAQIERLASFIMEHVPGEPSQSEGAVDCAIRIIRNSLSTPPDASAIRDGALDIPECVLSLCADKITLSFESGEEARCAFNAIEAALAGTKP